VADPNLRILILSTPKTGSTWLRNLLAGVYRLPQLYLRPGFGFQEPGRTGPRWIAQYHILPNPELTGWIRENRAEVITTIRHPGDVLISLYHHIHNFRAKTLDPDKLLRMLSEGFERTGLTTYSTGRPFSADLTCSLEWMAREGTHVVRYEDLRVEPLAALRALTSGILPVADERIEDAIDMCDLGLMRAMARSYGGFFREGRIGGWRDLLPPAVLDVFRQVEPYPAQLAALGYTMEPDDPAVAREIPPRRRHPMLALERFENGVRAAPMVIKCYFWEPRERQALWNPRIDSAAPDSFYAWLNAPCGSPGAGIYESLPLSNLAAFVYAQRPDLRQAYPDLRSRDRVRYAHWFLRCAQKEHELDAAFIEPVREGVRRWAHAACAIPGADFYASLPLPSLAAFFYDQRPDLQAAYPDLTSGDRYEYLQWFLRSAGAEYGLGPEYIDPVREAVERWEKGLSPVDGRIAASNFVRHICQRRIDVLGSFPEIRGPERRALVRSVIRAAKALHMDAAYVHPLERSLGRHWLPKWLRTLLGRPDGGDSGVESNQ
jgi:hypothetical protein